MHFNGCSEAYDAFQAPGKSPLPRLRFPTRPISLEDFIEHLIVEVGAPTRQVEKRALELLAESHARFDQERRTRD